MVTFVSQCEKKALPSTRRELGAFTDRIGDNTWQTVITQELLSVKSMRNDSCFCGNKGVYKKCYGGG